MENTKFGISLAGGGLQGFAHIGALKALEELGIKIKYISGTSTGSAIASLYAMGYTPDEIQKICKEKYKKILKIRKKVLCQMAINFLLHKETRVEGIIDGGLVENFINEAAKEKGKEMLSSFTSTKIAIATVDTISMKECLFISEELKNKDKNIDYIKDITIGKAVRSSMAFPAIFTTSNYEKYNFLDGGTVDNLPVQVLKDMGATKTIAICFDLNKYTPSKSLEGVLVRALDIFSHSGVEKAKEIADIAIEIYNPNTSLLSMDEIEKTVQNGYDAVMRQKEKILKYV